MERRRWGGGLYLFKAPYLDLQEVPPGLPPDGLEMVPGTALVWRMGPTGRVHSELEWVTNRPIVLPLLIVLPEPSELSGVTHIVRRLPDLYPRDVLTSSTLSSANVLKQVLASPPRSIPRSVARFLTRTDVLPSVDEHRIEAVFRAALNVTSVEDLARQMCLSRRTLGRHFRQRGLPVPSHWLQFARLLHVAIQLQNSALNIGRVAARYGYPDGFTMSNTMKRLIGHRPSFVRVHLGWEWILDAWLRREGF